MRLGSLMLVLGALAGCAPSLSQVRAAEASAIEANSAEPEVPIAPSWPEPREDPEEVAGEPPGADARGCPGSVPRSDPSSGYLTPAEIMATVRESQGSIRECFEVQSALEPGLHGRITIAWLIDCDGHVASTRLVSSSMDSAPVEDCILARVLEWRFAEPRGGRVDVTFPFVFGGDRQ